MGDTGGLEVHLIGILGGPSLREGVRETLGREGLARSDGDRPSALELCDRDDQGLWLTGEGARAGALAPLLARAGGVAVRHYRARVESGPDGLAIALDGWICWPERDEPVPIGGVRDGWLLSGDEQREPPLALARGALEVAAASREGFELADAAIERWIWAGSPEREG